MTYPTYACMAVLGLLLAIFQIYMPVIWQVQTCHMPCDMSILPYNMSIPLSHMAHMYLVYTYFETLLLVYTSYISGIYIYIYIIFQVKRLGPDNYLWMTFSGVNYEVWWLGKQKKTPENDYQSLAHFSLIFYRTERPDTTTLHRVEQPWLFCYRTFLKCSSHLRPDIVS
jgi:hypothetical protein